MPRNPRRASGTKALQAIKETANLGRHSKVQKENAGGLGRQKRTCSPTSLVPEPKRNFLGDVKNVIRNGQGSKPSKASSNLVLERVKPPSQSSSRKPLSSTSTNQTIDLTQISSVTPVAAVLKATTLDDSNTLSPEIPCKDNIQSPDASKSECEWKDIDKAEANDPLFSSEYAPEIYQYMRQREIHFLVPAYMSSQPDITASMRTILVDWLIEVQENFELFHETLYLAVQLTDAYLTRKNVKREYLQLVGATCMLIAAKFEELNPPLVDDFLYLCDDAYTHQDMLKMEREVLHALDYDLNIPVAYRFLRRLARAAEATMETHTLARYISESTLQDYSFVTTRPSAIAASSMYLALRMKKLGPWTPTLEHYSGYSVDEMLPLVKRLNTLIQTPLGQTATVRSKYSHEVFFKVATLAPLGDIEEDAKLAMSES